MGSCTCSTEATIVSHWLLKFPWHSTERILLMTEHHLGHTLVSPAEFWKVFTLYLNLCTNLLHHVYSGHLRDMPCKYSNFMFKMQSPCSWFNTCYPNEHLPALRTKASTRGTPLSRGCIPRVGESGVKSQLCHLKVASQQLTSLSLSFFSHNVNMSSLFLNRVAVRMKWNIMNLRTT